MDARPYFVQVADELAARIKAGKLKRGDKLPSEAELVDEFDVARGTARRAVQELRDRGLVATFPARGTFVL